MIDVNNIINYNRTDEELEELILFLIAVAGKKASTVARQLDDLLLNHNGVFRRIRMYADTGILRTRIKQNGFGCYTRLEKAFAQIATSNINLRTCTKEDLMKIHGIGRKSASCFLAWTRKGERVAMLDTHLLKYLKSVKDELSGYVDIHRSYSSYSQVWKLLDVNIPKSTPTSKKLYDRLELAYLKLCSIKKVDPTEFDLEIWKYYSQGLDKKNKDGKIIV